MQHQHIEIDLGSQNPIQDDDKEDFRPMRHLQQALHHTPAKPRGCQCIAEDGRKRWRIANRKSWNDYQHHLTLIRNQIIQHEEQDSSDVNY